MMPMLIDSGRSDLLAFIMGHIVFVAGCWLDRRVFALDPQSSTQSWPPMSRADVDSCTVQPCHDRKISTLEVGASLAFKEGTIRPSRALPGAYLPAQYAHAET